MVLGLRGFPNVQGGVESHSQELYPRLVELGYKVDVICRAPYVKNQAKQWKGVNFHPLWSPSSSGFEAMLHSILGVLFAAIKRPDILHIHAIGPAIVTPVARLFGLKVVVTHHGPDYDREKWGAGAKLILKMGERLGVSFSTRRIVISKVIQSLVLEKYGKNSDLIPNGVVPAKRVICEPVVEGLEKHKYFLLVSRMVPEKRHLDLIKAFKKAAVKGWELVLVGDLSDDTEYIRKVVSSASNGKIVLTGYKSGNELAGLFSCAGLFILPSSHEGLPIALLEAMSFGLPVLASDIPAHAELELDEHCYFPLGDVEALAVCMQKIVKDEQFRKKQGALGKSMVAQRYNWDQIAISTSNCYQKVLSERC